MTLSGEYEAYDGLGLAALVRSGDVTPKDLVACAVERIEALDPTLNAVVNRMFASAYQAAEGPLPEGPFSGVPFLLKDLSGALGGHPLTASCRFLAGFTPAQDSELVARYKRAGLVFVGQTNVPEFGIMPVTESRFRGPAHNPWNTGHTPGGSSGGSAAAVAAGFVPMAHGNDGGGSIRIPASCCGLFGLKPTRGRNPLGPEVGDGWGGFVQDHVLTRSVRDSAALLDATQGADLGAPYWAPPITGPFADEVARDPGRLRIGFTAKSLFGRSTHPDCAAAVEDAARLCESLGHSVEEASPDFDRAYLVHCFLVLLAAETARVIRWAGTQMGRTPRPDGFEPQTWVLGLIGRSVSGEEHAEALEAAYMAGRRIAGFFQTFDLLLAPTMAYPPARIGHFDLTTRQALELALLRRLPLKRLLDKVLDVLSGEVFEATGNTMLFNMTGQPAASVPLCWNAAGLPIGVQFVGRFGDEATLFRLASQLEQARPWFDRRPPRLPR